MRRVRGCPTCGQPGAAGSWLRLGEPERGAPVTLLVEPLLWSASAIVWLLFAALPYGCS